MMKRTLSMCETVTTVTAALQLVRPEDLPSAFSNITFYGYQETSE